MIKYKIVNFIFVVVYFFCAFGTVFAKSAPWVGKNFSGGSCSRDDSPIGHFDYTNAAHKVKHLEIVEKHHFTKEIRLLIKGKSSSIPAEIDYTLRAWPNHHKALNSLMYYRFINQYDIVKGNKPNLISPLECYFQRAINFSSKDATSSLLYAIFLKKIKKFNEADKYYQRAIAIRPDELLIRYNYGLFLFKIKKYEQAMSQARVIYRNEFSQMKLKQKLVASGHWKK